MTKGKVRNCLAVQTHDGWIPTQGRVTAVGSRMTGEEIEDGSDNADN
jgi:hypothetical protein